MTFVDIVPLGVRNLSGSSSSTSSCRILSTDLRSWTRSFGEVGEICIRGPQVMTGYWKRPDETAHVMTADGFLKSGDIGFMNPQGYTKIVDRKKYMILVSGFNVYPNEIEEVVARHPKVLEVAAIGVTGIGSGSVAAG